ncbi:MAG: metal-dependent hydrolase [Candidatus Doudnabacteria bacterium]|nr:metal-dependent hydrolase [Candidatus Doudnabacteria bacterium]
MLPPGHVAAGYLTAQALLKIVKPELPQAEINQLLWWGFFWGFAPDLDNFAAFLKVKSFYYNKKDNSIHRQFYTHIPVLWLLAGLAVYFLAANAYWQMFGLLIWLGSWSHFLLDSIEYGVMWLWPFNKELWAFKNRGVKKQIDGESFFRYWTSFLKLYVTRLTFYIEIIILVCALVVFFKS